jgi:hypothetical protein
MICCQKCGNKRCPHATDHRHTCTSSNDTGQAGSAYAECKPHNAALRGDSGFIAGIPLESTVMQQTED